MRSEAKKVRAGFLRCLSYLLGLVLVTMALGPAARAQRRAQTQTRLRGCLRTMGEHTFILIGEDRLGYMLSGDRGVLSRHTDQEVEIGGTAAEPAPGEGSSNSSLQAQVLASAKNKKAKPVVSFSGLRNVQVSSLAPLAQQCSSTAAVRESAPE